MTTRRLRLTDFAPGGGCSCKLAPGYLEGLLRLVYGDAPDSGAAAGDGRFELLCGLDSGDDATVVRIDDEKAIVTTIDFFPPVVDDAYDWGRIAAANAASDVYAMGGEPLSAINLLAWPSERLGEDVAAEVLRGGRSVAEEAGFVLAGGHSIADDTPLYGLAVTGLADPSRLLRNDAARPGQPMSLTKPLGVGILNNRHKATGERFAEAVATMSRLNRDASRLALAAGITGVTDVTGFGLLGHLYKMARASGVTAVVDAGSVPYLESARESLRAGYLPGGTRRNLEWVRPHLESSVAEEELLLLADAQTSGGLLLAGEIEGAPVVGEFVSPQPGGPVVVVR